MGIKLRNANVIPTRDYETVEVLGLKIPLTKKLPYGAQVELIDLQNRYEEGEFGKIEFFMRVFCTFTLRLPPRDHVKWSWLAQQDLEDDEARELMDGTFKLLEFQKPAETEGDEGNVPKPTPRTKKAAS